MTKLSFKWSFLLSLRNRVTPYFQQLHAYCLHLYGSVKLSTGMYFLGLYRRKQQLLRSKDKEDQESTSDCCAELLR